jgi:hypothetical protein
VENYQTRHRQRGGSAKSAEKLDGLLRISISIGLGFIREYPGRDRKRGPSARFMTLTSLTLEENIPCGATAIIEVPL